ncbi:hypothetical protein BC937DRAFT_94815 [Endogone sp. FLAS-F59071]|nr:hypothetical protein BC937DRAFT_94815 [Endogone sp. FLAS-F59071]|eukprot:RUS20610.1 hypothetical protein BC937DRAFT_94815 [Endogone sp. FLAS-F59071]
MSYQTADIEFAESLLARVLEGVKETFDIFAGGTDFRHDKFRMGDSTLLINVALYVQDGGASTDLQCARMEQIVAKLDEQRITLDNGQPVTLDIVRRDVDIGEYLARWVTEFGRTIYFWEGFGMDIEQQIPRDQFNRILLFLQNHPQKRDDVRRALEALRPEHLVIPRAIGGNFKTPYRTLFDLPNVD